MNKTQICDFVNRQSADFERLVLSWRMTTTITLTERGEKAASLIKRQCDLQKEIDEFVQKETEGSCCSDLATCNSILADDVISAQAKS
jgi:hypothetical protein